MGKEVSGVLFARRVARFLQGLGELSENEREEFVEGIYARGEAQKFGEAILLLIDKADEIEKPALVARILVAHVRGQFDYTTFQRLSLMVNRCVLQDLPLLKDFREGIQPDPERAEALFTAGLLSSGGLDDGGVTADGGTIYVLNRFGRLLATLL